MTGQMCIIYWAWNPSMEDLLQNLSYQKDRVINVVPVYPPDALPIILWTVSLPQVSSMETVEELATSIEKGFGKNQCSNTVEVHGIRRWDWSAVMLLKSFILVDVIVIMVTLDSAFLASIKIRSSTKFGLINHASMLCCIEKCFCSYSNMYYYILDEGEMYPNCGHHDNLSGFGFGNKIMDGLNGWQ